MPIGAPPRQTPTRKVGRNPLFRIRRPSSKESCNSDWAEMNVFWIGSKSETVVDGDEEFSIDVVDGVLPEVVDRRVQDPPMFERQVDPARYHRVGLAEVVHS